MLSKEGELNTAQIAAESGLSAHLRLLPVSGRLSPEVGYEILLLRERKN